MAKDHGPSVKNDKQYEGDEQAASCAHSERSQFLQQRGKEVVQWRQVNDVKPRRRNEGPEGRGRPQGGQEVEEVELI